MNWYKIKRFFRVNLVPLLFIIGFLSSLYYSWYTKIEPKYKAGECIQVEPSDIYEPWEKVPVQSQGRIMQVGIKKYRVLTYYPEYQKVAIDIVSIKLNEADKEKGLDDFSHPIECPSELLNFVEDPI